MTVSAPCAVCGAFDMAPFFEARAVPTNSCILLPTPDSARAYPRGDLSLSCCGDCGFIANVAFDPSRTEYSGRYEETQAFSATFNRFHESLALDLVERFGVHERDVIEIGCGKGEFLALLAETGANRCVGFDPSFDPARAVRPSRGSVEVETRFFTAADGAMEADFVVCKMTLEHIHEPRPLMAAMRRVAANRPDALVFVQVPDVTRILEDCAFEDLYYEHCAYFAPVSLARLAHEVGLRPIALESVYGGQYLTMVADVAPLPEEGARYDSAAELDRHLEAVESFATRCAARLDEWQSRLDQWSLAGRRVVLWGSGSKAVSFLSTLRTPAVAHVVDINPHRHGHFMPGTGQPIVAPAALVDLRPDVVVVLNRLYVDEISDDLGRLGLAPELVAL